MDIKYIINADIQCCLATTELNDVLLMLMNSYYDAIVVVNQKMLPIGVITEQDIVGMYSCSDSEDSDFRASELMASDVIKNKEIYICWEGDDVQIALSMINDRELCFLPVVNNEFCFVGVISFLKALSFLNNVMPFQSNDDVVYKH